MLRMNLNKSLNIISINPSICFSLTIENCIIILNYANYQIFKKSVALLVWL